MGEPGAADVGTASSTEVSARVEVIGTALYEACANIVEHGCDEDGRGGLQVWWLPGYAARESGSVWPGGFVIRDAGRPFRPHDRHPTDFNELHFNELKLILDQEEPDYKT